MTKSKGLKKIPDISYLKKNQEKDQKEGLRIIPISGLGEVGRNMTVFELNQKILIVDCGVSFPDNDSFGERLVIPDFSYLKKNRDRIVGMVITHGHEDHIGAIPYFIREVYANIPIFTSQFTADLISKKVSDRIPENAGLNLTTIQGGDSVKIGGFDLEFFSVAHSIPESLGIIFRTPYGNVVHTGDWKLDLTPIDGTRTDLNRLSRLSREEGVRLLLCDSTNAEKAGYSRGEREVVKNLEKVIASHKSNRIIITTFSSNVSRVAALIRLAEKYGRKIFLYGRSMVDMHMVAMQNKKVFFEKETVLPMSQISSYPDSKILMIVTGSQGEPMSALSRISSSVSGDYALRENDVVIFSSSTIPGNEKDVSFLMGNIRSSVHTLYYNKDLYHASGHAYADEIKLLLYTVRPEYYMPLHGEVAHLEANKSLGVQMGIPEGKIFVSENGGALLMKKTFLAYNPGYVQAEESYVLDFLQGNLLTKEIKKEREALAKGGLLSILFFLDKEKNSLKALRIDSAGYMKKPLSLKDLEEIAKSSIEESLLKKRPLAELEKSLKESLAKSFFQFGIFPPEILVILADD